MASSRPAAPAIAPAPPAAARAPARAFHGPQAGTIPGRHRRPAVQLTGALALALFAMAGCSRHASEGSGPSIPTTAGDNAASAVAPEALPGTPMPPASGGLAMPDSAASGGAPVATGASGPVGDADAEFMRKAAASGHFELAAAELAAQKATRPEVKAYAQMLVKDHTVANAELTTLAQAHQVALPTSADDSHSTALGGLQSASGPAFDAAFLSNVGQHQHQVDLQLFTIESESGHDADVKQWAAKTTAAMNRHLVEAQRLSGQPVR